MNTRINGVKSQEAILFTFTAMTTSKLLFILCHSSAIWLEGLKNITETFIRLAGLWVQNRTQDSSIRSRNNNQYFPLPHLCSRTTRRERVPSQLVLFNTASSYPLVPIIRVTVIPTRSSFLYNKLCRQQTEVIQNHDNENVRSIGQDEARHRKYKLLKLGGGQAYDRSSD
jgi:hypothetical protein